MAVHVDGPGKRFNRSYAVVELPALLQKDDRLVFYFAGHGIALEGDDGPAGYLIAVSAQRQDHTTLVAR